MYTLLLIILVLLFVGGLPRWSHSANWGYGPTGITGVLLVILVLFLLLR